MDREKVSPQSFPFVQTVVVDHFTEIHLPVITFVTTKGICVCHPCLSSAMLCLCTVVRMRKPMVEIHDMIPKSARASPIHSLSFCALLSHFMVTFRFPYQIGKQREVLLAQG